jgi:periplasmic protein TonB
MFAGLEVVHAHPARRWTAIASFTLQAALVGAALVLPLLQPESLPEALARRPIFRPLSAGVEHPPVTQNSNSSFTGHAAVYPLMVRTGPTIPMGNVGPTDPNAVGPPGMPVIGVRDGTDNVLSNIIGTPVVHPVPAPPTHTAPVSVIMEGNLVHKVEPRYPVIAQQVGIQGAVVINALISRNGNIEQMHIVSGQPLPAAAALAAVREWKYRPYYLNGEPVEVETEITVNFIWHR